MTKYNSGFEGVIAKQLTELGIKFDYEKESFVYFLKVYQSECKACGAKEVIKWHTYTPDFFLYNGVIIEVKGKLEAKHRKIAKAMREQYPTVDYRMVFMKNNKISRSSKTRYGDWADRLGIPWAIGRVPEEWTVPREYL